MPTQEMIYLVCKFIAEEIHSEEEIERRKTNE